MACGTQISLHQEDAGDGRAQLPDTRDGQKGDLGLPAGLQPDPHTDGPGSSAGRLPPLLASCPAASACYPRQLL